ncbi:hypothetical protein JOC94_003886 [Bacillus thermophilus]|uniref:Hydroxymethylglutaryl-CoA lyase n=1 Tax=Siminovitchia thermophila TaxID=1245522 RepID=A0ABS2RB30_9BACI|nr:hypothetical protein [Siminovitchia thermophila]
MIRICEVGPHDGIQKTKQEVQFISTLINAGIKNSKRFHLSILKSFHK